VVWQVLHSSSVVPHHSKQSLKFCVQQALSEPQSSVGFGVIVGGAVVGLFVGLGDTVGTASRTVTSAQLKKSSGHVVERVPSLGYGGVHACIYRKKKSITKKG
jgi:hypothetical protein